VWTRSSPTPTFPKLLRSSTPGLAEDINTAIDTLQDFVTQKKNQFVAVLPEDTEMKVVAEIEKGGKWLSSLRPKAAIAFKCNVSL
jgi:hypothetical protein